MATSFVSINLQTADYRLGQRPTPLPIEVRIKLLRKALADRWEFSWMESYKRDAALLAELEAQVNA